MTRPVVVAVDGSAPAAAAVEWAAADAQQRGLALRIVHVCERRPPEQGGLEPCEETLAVARDRALALTRDVEVDAALLTGNVVEALLAESASAESMVLGSRGLGGFAGMLLGSVGMGVAGHAAGPVVIVRRTSPVRHGRVVVGDDGSEQAAAAVAYAIEQARARRVTLHVVCAWQTPVYSPYAAAYETLTQEGYEYVARAAAARAAAWRDGHPDVPITDAQVHGHPVNALIEAGGAADLVVVGSRGRGGFASAVLGSVGHAVLHRLTCPVAVVRPRPGGG
ncbi:Universal stress protein [Nonomuraea coxensis DSM 45129]|uniref:Universal stress protein n=1 Tax=Nonomuraea coxensis DSM 45129 TaxID=1122611 RepID=A0ABX8U0E0_9ACTN|nr:universal stress protein [Nonomuraea coxensis]QYC41160.1 Universal stress protein [Nonomuraea coxensis DSM 45129]